jgi:hypothetical protein
MVKGLSLRPGAKVAVSITKPSAVGVVTSISPKRNAPPTTERRCLPPGAKKAIGC